MAGLVGAVGVVGSTGATGRWADGRRWAAWITGLVRLEVLPWTLQWNDGVNNIVGLPEHVHDGYPATVSGQGSYLNELRAIIDSVPDGLGRGFFYWEPAWVTAPGGGSPWENVTLFNFSGEILSSSDFFRPTITRAESQPGGTTEGLADVHAYPVPARGFVFITYSLAKATSVDVRLYDLLGREVAVPLTWAGVAAGSHRVAIEAGDLAAGIYFYRIRTGAASAASGRIVLDR